MFEYKDLEYLKNELKVDLQNGVSCESVENRKIKYGSNVIEQKRKNGVIKTFLSQLKDPMIYILLIAIGISAFLKEYSDAIVIVIVVFLNAIIGTIQEVKTEKSLESLKKMTVNKSTVIRGGKKHLINSEDIVVGDVVILEPGIRIGADLRIIESNGLKIDESSLTGESKPVEKKNFVLNEEVKNIADKSNLAYMSTCVVQGRGKGVAIAVGMDSEIGKVARLLNENDGGYSPLQKKLSSLGKYLGIIVIFICLILFLVSLIDSRNVLEMLISSISLAVAAIPEGLPAVVTIVLALGIQRMSKMKAMVKKLYSVETIGAVNIICSDKTGTITENKLKCDGVYECGKYRKCSELVKGELTMCALLCNDSYLDGSQYVGSPMECELRRLGESCNVNVENYKRIDVVEFNSTRKMMSTLNDLDGKLTQYTKGAFDRIIDKCNYQMIDGKRAKLDPFEKEKIKRINEEKSSQGKRILAFAKKDDVLKIDENDMVFLGFLAFFDPPREGVKESVEDFNRAGIEVKMITGDYLKTGFSIAREVGIASDISECVSGQEMDKMNEIDFANCVKSKKVFARVSPEHKSKIVDVLKLSGNVVAMTGDGVNDAPSLKKSDIGISMGINGNDVAKEASDIILLDDDFSTIKVAVEEGRKIYENIKKTILFLLSSNLAEIIVMMVAIVLKLPLPLMATHILIVNLLTDSVPALCLGVDDIGKDILELKPRNLNEPLFSKHTIIRMVIYGSIIAILTLFAYCLPMLSQIKEYGSVGFEFLLGDESSVLRCQTYAFVVLSGAELFYSISLRESNKGVIRKETFSNKYLNAAVVGGIGISIVCIFTDLNKVLNFHQISIMEFIILLLIALSIVAIRELESVWFHMKQKHTGLLAKRPQRL